MDPERQRAISRKGGKAAHEQGKAHEFTSEEAREAGRQGGRTVSADREHMAEIGRKGGLKTGKIKAGAQPVERSIATSISSVVSDFSTVEAQTGV